MTIKSVDVADYILNKYEELSAMKLQKLVYYSQAWHLAWEDKPLFIEEIQAWEIGPVIPELYRLHQRHFLLKRGFFKGDTTLIPEDSHEVIDSILPFYGDKDIQWLSHLTRIEKPWKSAREGLGEGERGNSIITHEMMAEYYSKM